jgi:hypothetical protein
VTNIFQLNYDERLKNWYLLRKTIEQSDIKTKCLETDKWWQQAPLVNHYLHPHDLDNWPNPWELLVENNYCTVARALGMCYTLILLGIKNIEFVLAKNDSNEDVVLVLVDNAKYILNYWPNTVLNNNLSDFKVVEKIDIKRIIDKIGKI